MLLQSFAVSYSGNSPTLLQFPLSVSDKDYRSMYELKQLDSTMSADSEQRRGIITEAENDFQLIDNQQKC